MEKFKVGLKSHLKNGVSILLGIFICGFFVYMLTIANYQDKESFLVIPMGIFVFGILPTIIIHINYYLVNRGDSLIFAFRNSTITIIHKGTTTTFTLNDIDHIEKNMSYNQAANRAGFIPWDDYNHTIIYLKDGQKFVVTSLLVPNLKLPLPEEKIVIKTNFYRLVL